MAWKPSASSLALIGRYIVDQWNILMRPHSPSFSVPTPVVRPLIVRAVQEPSCPEQRAAGGSLKRLQSVNDMDLMKFNSRPEYAEGNPKLYCCSDDTQDAAHVDWYELSREER
jgi:hypothetical protein